MKKVLNSSVFIFCMYLLILFYSAPLNAQPQNIDPDFKLELANQKTLLHRDMIECELQKTLNQDNYDVKYYDLDLTPDPVTAYLSGAVTVVGEITSTSLDQVDLNFWDGMHITGLYLSGIPLVSLNYTRNFDMLSIQLDRTYSQGEVFSIEIVYNGQPQTSPYYSFAFDTHNDEPMIWTLSSVFGARAWWPCKDVPSDKPDSMDIRVTVPDDLIVASNGSLRQATSQNNTTTYWWHEGYPVATYLVFLAIHPYEMHYDQYLYNNNADTMQINFYSFAGNYDQYRDINQNVKNMIAVFAELFGEYPFVDEKYGQADFLWSGGMEHQTCTSYGSWNEPLFVHEIAHQWWGDMITCDSFHHIWLNEGFASYSEVFWFEHKHPGYTASEYQMDYQLYLGPGTVYVEDPQNENIFDLGLSYYKGSWILHMLRRITGDEVFFNILKTYYASVAHQYGTATSEQFQAICEQISGINLDKFFHQWLHEEFYPRYAYSWNWTQNAGMYHIQLEIEQLQTNHTFWMPIDVTVTTSAGETTFVVWDSLQTQSFQLSLTSEPLSIELDRNNWILKIADDPVMNPQFDQGILLVNGVLFETYDSEIRAAYAAKAFWGEADIDFWDCFNAPANGYPSTLPEPIGHGKVPADILGNYSTVIWIGNHYGGDVGMWQQTSILSYLEAGGNVILLSRRGQDFIFGDLLEYLGVTWAESPGSVIQNCVAVYPGLQSNIFTGDQSLNAVFETNLNQPESTLLFQETLSFDVPRGLGVWRKPEDGGEFKSDGGQFVFISGRPYRYEAATLKRNIETILQNFFDEGTERPEALKLYQNYPNPFSSETTIEFDLIEEAHVKVQIFTILGEKISTLANGWHTAQNYRYEFDATGLASGVYFYRIQTSDFSKTKKLLYIK